MKFLLSFSGKRSLLILFFTSFVILAFDLISIALIFPFLSLFIAPDAALKNQYINKVYQSVGFTSPNEFVYAVGTVLLIAYLLKLILKTILNGLKFSTIADITYRLSSHLFKGLLEARYALFTEQGVSEMINVVNAQTVHSVICLESFVKVVNELLFLLIVLGITLYINLGITLLAILLFVVMGTALYFGLVKKIEGFGKIHSRLNVLVYKYGFAMANSIKDIKIMRLENNYINKFSLIWQEYSQNDSKSKTAKSIPVDLSETLIFSGIVLVCFYLLMTNQDVKNMFPLLGVLAVTAMRVLPSFNRIISGYHEYRFYKPSLALVQDLSNKINANRQEIEHLELPFAKSLEIRGLSFTYADKKILESISLRVEKGGSFALVGTSGAGKSTLLDVLVGLREAGAGAFYLDGIQFDPFNTDALRNHIGYVPQNVNLIDESIAFNISFEIDFDRDKMRRAITIARLDEFVDSLPDGLHTVLGESGVRVSGGQKQRIGIARALYRDPEILIFDEATSALDSVTERELMSEINQLSGDKTLIIVAHRLSTVEKCKVIHLLDNGCIIARGSQAELLESSSEYRTLYYQQDQP
jgi:ABC-type bacteriocin/lantibiotic exporter with double-glycine peptidase domain